MLATTASVFNKHESQANVQTADFSGKKIHPERSVINTPVETARNPFNNRMNMTTRLFPGTRESTVDSNGAPPHKVRATHKSITAVRTPMSLNVSNGGDGSMRFQDMLANAS